VQCDPRILVIFKVKDPDARDRLRGRIADMGSSERVANNVWELAGFDEDEQSWWDEELKRWEEIIDPRTDVIYLWYPVDGRLVRSTIGGDSDRE